MMAVMRVLFATAELSPIATVGGLAAAAAGLGAELRRAGVDLELVMPDYGGIELDDETRVELDVPAWVGRATLRRGDHPDVGGLTLIDVEGMARPHPYLRADGTGWPDNESRFFRFSRAVTAAARLSEPDVVHLNDWHTATALASLDRAQPTVLSIHNLAYQGLGDGSWLDVLGPRAEHFEWYGGTNPLSGAIALADRVVAVSPTYAREIRTAVDGFGLDEPLRQRGPALVGILNGIDTDVWDPRVDPHLPETYDDATLDAKDASRAALHARFGWPDDRRPLATVVTRLTHQKGIDLLAPLIPLLDAIPMRLAILGSGDAELAARLRRAADDHPDVFAFVEGYDETLSHLMFAGGDLFVVPSRFEPCGLTQMQAMRYGTVPVVTAVGGLADTVPDADDRRDGLGFVAVRAAPADVFAALVRAARRVSNTRRRRSLQQRMMRLDWSWTEPARRYAELYESVLDDRIDAG